MIVTIAMGIKKSEGYSIKIKNVEIWIENDFAKIYVEETSPGDEQNVTDATITYPCTKIKFSKNLNNLIIINEETNEIFEKVEDSWRYSYITKEYKISIDILYKNFIYFNKFILVKTF